MHIRVLAFLIPTLCLAAGCQSITYSPQLSLGASSATIGATVRIDEFRDETPSQDHEPRFLHLVATEPGSLAGSLATNVTNEVLADLQRNQVFREISKNLDNPDLVLAGVLRRFFGASRILWFTIPIDPLWYLGLPCCADEGMVDLLVTVSRPDGTEVARYEASSSFGGIFTVYNNRLSAIGTSLNRAFDRVVQSIRDQMLDDKDLLSRQAALPPNKPLKLTAAGFSQSSGFVQHGS